MHALVARLPNQSRRFLLRRRDLPHVVPLCVQRSDCSGALHHRLIRPDERNEIADTDNPEIAAFGAPYRCLIQRRQSRATTWLPQDARVQHIRPHDVMDEGSTCDFRRQVAARRRLADIAIRGMRLRRRAAVDIAGKILGGRETPIVMPGRSIAAPENPILDRQFRRTAIQSLCQPVQHASTQLSRHQSYRTARHLDRLARRGLPLIRRILRVARQHGDPIQIHIEFVGCDLCQCGHIPLAKLDLAHCQPHRAIRLEPDPLLHPSVILNRQRQSVAHAPVLSRSMAAAFSTARNIRGCAPQRQRFLSSARTISPRVGDGLRSSSAFALMMMPDRQ